MQKALLLNEQLEDIRATLFRQTLFAEFELFLHEQIEQGAPLTPMILNEKFMELNKTYYGPDLYLCNELANEWARIPHFYYNFYVYQYATGHSAACTLAQRILQGSTKAQKAYLTFLSRGASRFPLDLLRDAGVDMTTKQPIQETISWFRSLLDELSHLFPLISS